MLGWSVVAFVLALLAGVLGFFGLVGALSAVAKVVFFGLLALSLLGVVQSMGEEEEPI